MPCNIVNSDALEAYVARAFDAIPDAGVRGWGVKRFRDLAADLPDMLVRFDPAMATARDWPDWVLRRMEEGAELYLFPDLGSGVVRDGFDARLSACSAFFSGLTELAAQEPGGAAGERDAARRVLSGLRRMTLDDAERVAASWTERLARRTSPPSPSAEPESDADPAHPPTRPDSEQVAEAPSGKFFFRINTPQGLDAEGDAMGNCVGHGQYDAELLNGTSSFLSLRGANGRPRATIHIQHRHIHEFRGRANLPPATKHATDLLWLMNRLDLPPTQTCAQLLGTVGAIWCPDAPQGRRFGPLAQASRAITMARADTPRVRRATPSYTDSNGQIVAAGAVTYLVDTEAGTASFVLGSRLSVLLPPEWTLSNPRHATALRAAVSAVTDAASQEGDTLSAPDPAAASLLAAVRVHHADGRYGRLEDLARPLRTLPSGARLLGTTDTETGQQILVYVDRDGQRLATFALRRREEVDRDRLYVLELEEGFLGAQRAVDMADMLDGLEVFLSDAKAAALLGIVFCRLRWAYLPLAAFEAEITSELLARDLSASFSHRPDGGIETSIRKMLSPAGKIVAIPQGERSPFHIITHASAERDRRAAEAVVFALNRLMFPTPQDRLGDPRIRFDRSLYAYALAKSSRPSQPKPSSSSEGGLVAGAVRVVRRLLGQVESAPFTRPNPSAAGGPEEKRRDE